MSESVAVQGFPHVLAINQFTLSVHLGVGEEERAVSQPIVLDIRIYYPSATQAMQTDAANYDCYDVVMDRIRTYCDGKQFHLIEYLASKLFDAVRDVVDPACAVWLKLTKPNIHPYLLGGASFVTSDLPAKAWHPPAV